MRARRLRLNRHHRQWILPLSSNYIFQAGGAPSRPWQKRLFVPGDLDLQLLPVSDLFVPG
jgi:hypothetical protein